VPINSSGYRKVDKLTSKDIPALAPDEWIRLRGQRDSINDLYARARATKTVKSASASPDTESEDEFYKERDLAPGEQDPDVLELEGEAEVRKQDSLELHNGEFWFYVYDYLLVKFHVRDTAGGADRWMDSDDPEDRLYLFKALGEDLLPFLAERAGGTPPSDMKKDDGSPVEFPRGRAGSDSGNEEEVART